MGLTSLHGEAAMEESSTTMSVAPAEAQHVDLSELEPAATMLDAAEADHVELVELPPVQLGHVERLIQYIRQAHPNLRDERMHLPERTFKALLRCSNSTWSVLRCNWFVGRN